MTELTDEQINKRIHELLGLCQWCRVPFTKKRKGQSYCSLSCVSKYRHSIITLPTQSEQNNYNWRGGKKDFTCNKCGKTFQQYESEYNRKNRQNKNKYCSVDCRKQGFTIDKDGYKLIYKKDHSFANSTGYVREHRLIMEQYIGRVLDVDEIVHHKDEDNQNNSIDNLEILSPSQHQKLHQAEKKRDKHGKYAPPTLSRAVVEFFKEQHD